MYYLQVAVTVTRDRASRVSDWLSEQGALSVTVESAENEIMFDEAEPGEPAWLSQRLTALFDSALEPAPLMSGLNALSGHQESRVERLADQDWERAWLDQFEPVRVTDKLWVCPGWLSPPDPSAVNLRIDPGLAFGTGTHPTTYLCLQQLSGLDVKSAVVVDYGCGSGILAVAALAMGAERAYATDVDPRALDATRDNAAKNGVADRLLCVHPDELPEVIDDEPVDLVIANILAGTLVRLQRNITALCSADTRLMLSGILVDQAELVIAAYSDACGFETIRKEDWVVLLSRQSGPGT